MWGLATHPSCCLFLTCGHDRQLCLWDGQEHALAWSLALEVGGPGGAGGMSLVWGYGRAGGDMGTRRQKPGIGVQGGWGDQGGGRLVWGDMWGAEGAGARVA